MLDFLLIALLAWPWNLMVWSAESLRTASQPRFEAVSPAGAPRVPRLVDSRSGNRQSHWLTAAVDERQQPKGIDSSLASSALDTPTVAIVHWPDKPASSLHCMLLPTRSIPLEHLCRLRC